MKKGFTLIELLAVIVILAIIALIATPIVLNIISDTRESAVLRSGDFYIDAVEYAVANAALNNNAVKAGTYPIMQDGNICLGILTNNICNANILKVEVDGEKPTSGTITISNGKILKDENTKIKIKDTILTFDSKKKLVIYKEEVGVEIPQGTTISGVWVFNETLKGLSAPILVPEDTTESEDTIVEIFDEQIVTFTSNNMTFNRIAIFSDGNGFIPDIGCYPLYYGDTIYYYDSCNGWDDSEIYRTVDFGTIEQEVSESFIKWMGENAVKQ